MAMDQYEQHKWEQIKHDRYLVVDALTRADDQLHEEAWDKDQFGYAYIQLARASDSLHAVILSILQMRQRRLTFEGQPQMKPEEKKK